MVELGLSLITWSVLSTTALPESKAPTARSIIAFASMSTLPEMLNPKPFIVVDDCPMPDGVSL